MMQWFDSIININNIQKAIHQHQIAMCKYITNLILMTYNNGLNCECEAENSLTTCLTQIGFKKSFLLESTLI